MNELTPNSSPEETANRADTASRRQVVTRLGAVAIGSFGLLATPGANFLPLQPAAMSASAATNTGPTRHTRHTKTRRSRDRRRNRRNRRR